MELQDRSIVVVTGEAGREGLSWAAGGQAQPQEAPVYLVFVAEPEAWRDDHTDVAERATVAGAWNAEFAAMFDSRDGFHALAERGLLRENAVKNAMISATYIMLAGASMGLATAPMNGWDPAKVKKVIGLGDRDDLAIAVLVTIGCPAGPVPHPGRSYGLLSIRVQLEEDVARAGTPARPDRRVLRG